VGDIYGAYISGDFVLGQELLKSDKKLAESVTAILHGKYGVPEG